MTGAEAADVAGRVAAHAAWYHTLELAPGVVTPGWFDTRPVLDQLPFPGELTGLRCLDIATFDGFWAFAMERRGAAEVLAIDLLDDDSWDWPVVHGPEVVEAFAQRKGRGEGFVLARDALGSRVERRELSIYDLDPGDVGTFDFVYLGSLLLHLKDPIGALEAVRSVCTGRLLVVDAVSDSLSRLHPRRAVASFDGVGRPWWWKPNQLGLRRMVESAGFEVLEAPRRFRMPPGAGQGPRPPLHRAARALRHRGGREVVLQLWYGDPHAAVLARPTGPR